MRQPNEYWLKYLIETGMGTSEIIEVCEQYQVPIPQRSYLDNLDETLQDTRPNRDDTRRYSRWLRKNRIYNIVMDETNSVKAREILTNHKIREPMERMVVGGVSLDDIVGYTEIITGVLFNREVIADFRHYFWDISIPSTRELTSFFDASYNGAVLTECWANGEEYALWKSGYRVEVDKDQAVKTMIHEGMMRFVETGSLPNNRETAMTAKMWAEIVFKGIEEQSASGDEIKEVVEQLKEIAIELEDADVVDINTLAGKNHSVQLHSDSLKGKTKIKEKVRL